MGVGKKFRNGKGRKRERGLEEEGQNKTKRKGPRAFKYYKKKFGGDSDSDEEEDGFHERGQRKGRGNHRAFKRFGKRGGGSSRGGRREFTRERVSSFREEHTTYGPSL